MMNNNGANSTFSANVSRVIPIGGTHNFRDAGGYPVVGAGSITTGMLFRSDGLHQVTDEGRELLAELGVQLVVDLRSDAERQSNPDALGDIEVISVPIFDSAAGDVADYVIEGKMPSLADIYRYMVELRGEQLTKAVKALAQAESFPAVVHCTAGKDRTGIVIALVLSALGVPDEFVIADYAATAQQITPEFREVLAAGSQDVAEHMLASDESDMRMVLDLLVEKYGGAKEFLLSNGLTESEFDLLGQALITDEEE